MAHVDGVLEIWNAQRCTARFVLSGHTWQQTPISWLLMPVECVDQHAALLIAAHPIDGAVPVTALRCATGDQNAKRRKRQLLEVVTGSGGTISRCGPGCALPIPLTSVVTYCATLPERPAATKAEFTLTIYQGTSVTVRRVEQTPGLLRGIRALLRQIESDTGTPRVVEGIAILPYGHYVWSGEGGAWSVYLYDEDMDAEHLSPTRETARARRQRSRLRWQERTHPKPWANRTTLANPTQRTQN